MIESLYPIVMYAKSINKNTADLTTIDMVNFTNKWMKQPIREDLIQMSKQTKQFNNAQTSRLTSDQVVDIEQADDDIGINMEEELQKVNDKIAESDVVCSMDLTKGDVEALLWGLGVLFNEYDMEGHEYQASLESLKVGLEGI